MKEFLHYYIGSRFISPLESGVIDAHVLQQAYGGKVVRAILRKLEDMTEEDKRHLVAHKKGYDVVARYTDAMVHKEYEWSLRLGVLTAAQFRYLLSKGYDLFNLIESGEAFDAKKVN